MLGDALGEDWNIEKDSGDAHQPDTDGQSVS